MALIFDSDSSFKIELGVLPTRWQSIPPVPCPRIVDTRLAQYDSKVYILCHALSYPWAGSIYEFDPANNTYTNVASLPRQGARR